MTHAFNALCKVTQLHLVYFHVSQRNLSNSNQGWCSITSQLSLWCNTTEESQKNNNSSFSRTSWGTEVSHCSLADQFQRHSLSQVHSAACILHWVWIDGLWRILNFDGFVFGTAFAFKAFTYMDTSGGSFQNWIQSFSKTFSLLPKLNTDSLRQRASRASVLEVGPAGELALMTKRRSH